MVGVIRQFLFFALIGVSALLYLLYLPYCARRPAFFSSPEPSGSQCELIVYPCSYFRRRLSCCRKQCSNIFSSETAWPIKAIFHVEPRKNYISCFYM